MLVAYAFLMLNIATLECVLLTLPCFYDNKVAAAVVGIQDECKKLPKVTDEPETNFAEAQLRSSLGALRVLNSSQARSSINC